MEATHTLALTFISPSESKLRGSQLSHRLNPLTFASFGNMLSKNAFKKGQPLIKRQMIKNALNADTSQDYVPFQRLATPMSVTPLDPKSQIEPI